jgi:hypothetical protein
LDDDLNVRVHADQNHLISEFAELAGTSRDGSDGTRTRDLRRDRPAF